MTTVSQAVAERQAAAVAAEPHLGLEIRAEQTYWTAKQRAVLATLGIKGASDADLAVYFHVCQRTGLDPFARQIYLIMRREKHGDAWVEKPTIQVGIDGFRVTRDRVAAKTGYLVEFEDTVWYDAAGGEHLVWLDDANAPAACKVVLVKRHIESGDALRFPAVLRTKSYMPMKDGRPQGQWGTQADHMIEKCCEAFASRRGFPNDLGGLYLEEEMSVSDVVREAQPRRSRARTIAARVEPQLDAGGGDAGDVAAGTSPATVGSAESPAVAGAGGAPVDGQETAPPPAASDDTPARPSDSIKMRTKLAGLSPTPDDAVALLGWLRGKDKDAVVTKGDIAKVSDYLEQMQKIADVGGEDLPAVVWADYREHHTGPAEPSG